MNRPPLDVEEALDLVVAAASHRSQNEKHSNFGKLVIDQYFVILKEKYKDDATASIYLDNLLISAAAAVRGFSVVRDSFGTKWQQMLEQKQYELEAAQKYDRYSPFKETGYWGKVVSIISGAGVGGTLGELANKKIVDSGLVVLSLAAVGIAVGLFAFDFILSSLKKQSIKRVNSKFPEDLEAHWISETLPKYKNILKNFLLSAIAIRERYYPELLTMNNERVFDNYLVPHIQFSAKIDLGTLKDTDSVNAFLEAIVEKHLTLGR